ncbi:hypothetical protein JP31_05015 [Gallibacterium anatis]|uniref:hypothetical protein n=1 Tax=Gallibacterium anatis TaxID=750 RepID=UPI000531FF51|nr:hypothetical protein [Gallibacterium anatis]KGQ27321.1 hypothetical protein JP31_05015 [Gallibacterium anatis]
MRNTYSFITDSLLFGAKFYIAAFSLLSLLLVLLATFSFFSWKTIVTALSVLFVVLLLLHWKLSKKAFFDREDKRYSQYWGKDFY